MHIFNKGNSNTKSLAYVSLVGPILEYGASCSGPYRESQINPLDHVQKKAVKFANHTNDSLWEILAQRRKIARICVLFETYTGYTGGQVKRTMLPEQG